MCRRKLCHHQHSRECLPAERSLPAQQFNEQICALTRKLHLHNLNNPTTSITTLYIHNTTSQPKLQTKNLESLTSTMTMADTTTTPSLSETAPTHIVESYHAVENRITRAIEILQGWDSHGGQPDFCCGSKRILVTSTTPSSKMEQPAIKDSNDTRQQKVEWTSRVGSLPVP